MQLIKKFLLKKKIQKKEKQLNKLKELKNSYLQLNNLENEIKRVSSDINSLEEKKIVKTINKIRLDNDSIFTRCTKCDMLLLQDKKHTCII